MSGDPEREPGRHQSPAEREKAADGGERDEWEIAQRRESNSLAADGDGGNVWDPGKRRCVREIANGVEKDRGAIGGVGVQTDDERSKTGTDGIAGMRAGAQAGQGASSRHHS